MAVETELKARVAEPEQLKNALSAEGSYCYGYHKKDSYWAFPCHKRRQLRIRNEEKTFPDGHLSRSVIVTYKTREMYGEIEVNNEREFTISDSAAFEEILTELGMEPDIEKEKQGWAWKLNTENDGPPVLAELSRLTRLGWFIELEIMGDARDEQTLRQNSERLLALLEKLGISRNSTETRPYTELLRTL